MNDFQEQAKNFLRNVVKQNPDKIKTGMEKAGDLVDKQTGGKYADKVDAVQEKVDSYVDSHADKAEPPADEETQETGDAVVGGTPPEVAEQPSSSAGSGTEGTESGGTATGTSDGGLPGPR
jgi:hypothetical protein